MILGVTVTFLSLNFLLARFDQAEFANELAPVRVSHWSGYIVDLHIQNRSEGVESVTASWIIPNVESTPDNTYCSIWVGIDGYGESQLIQAGTEHQRENGKLEYFAWYELLPATIITVKTLDIQPGDKITTSITLIDDASSTWLIKITDETEGRTFEKTVKYESPRKCVEWIVERPLVSGVTSTLADFGEAKLTNCQTTINGVTGTIGDFTYTPAVMVDSNDNALVSTSKLNTDGSGFTVTYLEPVIATPTPYT